MDFEEYVSVLKRKIKSQENNVFVCIGTSNILWDSVGPLVGSYLKEKINSKYIIGDMNNNICSKNDLMFYYPRLKNRFIVAIDVAISNELNNDIYVSNSFISMGTAFNKNRGNIGNISIKAGISNWQDITYLEVRHIAKFISEGILRI